jgi:small nuclear ribonucleoprotein (snRNP)-like protein
MIDKPIDALNFLRGSQVRIDLKDGNIIQGKLIAFDLTTNITLEIDGKNQLIQGKNVMTVAKA